MELGTELASMEMAVWLRGQASAMTRTISTSDNISLPLNINEYFNIWGPFKNFHGNGCLAQRNAQARPRTLTSDNISLNISEYYNIWWPFEKCGPPNFPGNGCLAQRDAKANT